MSEAPERIWIQYNHIPDSVALDKWDEEPDADEAHLFIKYIRADCVAVLLKAEREKALREAAETVQLGDTVQNTQRRILSLIDYPAG